MENLFFDYGYCCRILSDSALPKCSRKTAVKGNAVLYPSERTKILKQVKLMGICSGCNV